MEMQRLKVWGRDRYFDQFNDLFEKYRSATVLFGDPQIGKTTLVNELRLRLQENTESESFVGFHKAICVPHDPFMFAVSSLLSELYSSDNYRHQLPIIFDKLRQKFTSSKLKELVCALWSAASELPGMKAVGKFVDWLKGEVEGLDLSIKIPVLSAYEIVGIIRSIREACPQIRIALIVDDYSAGFEIGPSLAAPAWTHATLKHLLDQNISNLHLVLTWKETGETAEALEELRHIILSQSGTLIRLEHLEQKDTLDWVRNDLQDLAANVGEGELASLISGLPKVAVELRTVKPGDYASAKALSDQVKLGTYDYLHSYLEKCQREMRELLFQLATIEIPVGLEDIKDIARGPIENTIHDLKSAIQRNFLVEINVAGYKFYAFQHEVKRRVVLDHLFRLYHHQPFFVKAFGYFENRIANFAMSELVAPSFVALALRSAHFLSHEDNKYRDVEDFYRLFLSFCQKEASLTESMQLLLTLVDHPASNFRPMPLKSFLYVQLIEFEKLPNGQHRLNKILQEALKYLSKSPPDSMDALAAIHVLKFFGARFHRQPSMKLADQILHDLSQLKLQRTLPPLFLSEIAGTLCNMALDKTLGLKNMKLILQTSKRISNLQPEEKLREAYAQTLCNLAHLPVREFEWFDALLHEIELVALGKPLSAVTEEACVRALHDLAVTMDSVDYYEKMSSVFSLLTRFPLAATNNREIVRWCSRALYNFTAYFGRSHSPEKTMEAFDRLRLLFESDPMDREVVIPFAEATFNVSAMAGNTNDKPLLDRACGILKSLVIRYAEIEEVSVEYASSLSNAAQFLVLTKQENGEEFRQTVHDLEKHEKDSRLPSIAAIYATVLLNSVPRPPEIRIDPEWISFLLEEASRLRTSYPNHMNVIENCATTLANLVPFLSVDGRWVEVNETLDKLYRITTSFPEQKQLIDDFARATYMAWHIASKLKEDRLAKAFSLQAHQHGDYCAKKFNEFVKRTEND